MKKYLIFGYDKILVDYLILNNIEVILILDKWDFMDSIQISNNDLEKWFIVNDSQNIENVLEIISHENSDFKKFDVIFSRYESAIVNASILSEFLSKKNFLPIKTALLFRDKYLQKTALNKKVTMANFQIINNLLDFNIENLI